MATIFYSNAQEAFKNLYAENIYLGPRTRRRRIQTTKNRDTVEDVYTMNARINLGYGVAYGFHDLRDRKVVNKQELLDDYDID